MLVGGRDLVKGHLGVLKGLGEVALCEVDVRHVDLDPPRALVLLVAVDDVVGVKRLRVHAVQRVGVGQREEDGEGQVHVVVVAQAVRLAVPDQGALALPRLLGALQGHDGVARRRRLGARLEHPVHALLHLRRLGLVAGVLFLLQRGRGADGHAAGGVKHPRGRPGLALIAGRLDAGHGTGPIAAACRGSHAGHSPGAGAGAGAEPSAAAGHAARGRGRRPHAPSVTTPGCYTDMLRGRRGLPSGRRAPGAPPRRRV